MTRRVEQFLAAPDSIRESKSERAKAILRKAQDEARERQLAATKLKASPTMEDLLADIVRVAEDRNTNPWWRWRICSRKRYILFGHYPILFVDREFGQWHRALEVAGLRDESGTRDWRSARAAESRREHTARYIARYVRPYVAGADLRSPTRGQQLILSISDSHSTFMDPFTLRAFLAACRDLRPDVVYLNGDILEGSEISRHPQIPGWTLPLQLEFDFARALLERIRRAAPDSEIILGGGNHDVDRIASYLTHSARALANLRTMRFDRLLELEGLNVRLACGGTIGSPLAQEDEPRGMLLFGSYRVFHGEALGRTPAVSELESAGRSGQSGHVHRAQLFYGSTEATSSFSWMCTPCSCTDRAARAYISSTSTGWQRGFGVAHLFPDGRVHQYPVVTDGGRATVEGYTYVESKKETPNPKENWLAT